MSTSEASPGILRHEVNRFAPYHPWDRNFFLLWVLLIWLGIIMGFGPQIAHHFKTHAAPYPIIIPFHAALFVGWIILLTAQVLLIRSRKVELHRTLGMLGAMLAGAMIVIGPITALIAHRALFGQPGPPNLPAFLGEQLADILAFAGLAGAAFLLFRHPAAHKRLILLATLYISDAGFARWLSGPVITHLTGVDFSGGLWAGSLWGIMAILFLGNDVLVVGLGVYDWITRRRLHPAYVAGVAWTAALQLTAALLFMSPAWKAIALELIGH